MKLHDLLESTDPFDSDPESIEEYAQHMKALQLRHIRISDYMSKLFMGKQLLPSSSLKNHPHTGDWHSTGWWSTGTVIADTPENKHHIKRTKTLEKQHTQIFNAFRSHRDIDQLDERDLTRLLEFCTDSLNDLRGEVDNLIVDYQLWYSANLFVPEKGLFIRESDFHNLPDHWKKQVIKIEIPMGRTVWIRPSDKDNPHVKKLINVGKWLSKMIQLSKEFSKALNRA